jgi:hypothetical protein
MEKRTKPRNRKARAALEITAGATKEERIVKGALNRYLKVLESQKRFAEYIEKQVFEGIIDEYNKNVDPDMQIETIQLFSQGTDGLKPGEFKLSVERQIKRHLDSRAEMARNLVEEWLREYETRSVEFPDGELIYQTMKRAFFSKKGFKFNAELYHFLLLPESKIHDPRLKKAQKLLKESIKIDKSQWYAHIWKYCSDDNTYKKVTLNDV